MSIYYAIGELKYLDMFYQLMGHAGLHADTRAYLTAGFRDVREIYADKITSMIIEDPEYFDKSESPIRTNVDFSYFENMEKKIIKQKAKKGLDLVAAANVDG